jgi:hypothetical protein
MENDILTKEELINYLYFVFTKDRQSIEKFNDNLYIKKSTNKSVKLINNTLDEEFINLAKDNSEYRETLFCIDILIKLIYKYNFNINIFEESKRENVIDIYKLYIYNSLKNESKEFCCFDSNDIRKRFIRLNMVDCFKGATIDLYIGFLDLLLLKEIIDNDIHKKEVESFHHNLNILINQIPNLKIYEYNENPLSLINRIVYPQIKQSELFNNTNEPTKTQEVVSDDRINSETNNKQVNKQKKEPPKVEIDVEACVGSYDEKQTKKLYGECNNVVFKYCKIEDFVNSLNNPDECNLEVKNKSLLYVLYTYFFNFFGDKGEEKRNQLNTKFEIKISDYQKHKYSNKTASGKQKEFNESLASI